jgi:hypothetical protein
MTMNGEMDEGEPLGAAQLDLGERTLPGFKGRRRAASATGSRPVDRCDTRAEVAALLAALQTSPTTT